MISVLHRNCLSHTCLFWPSSEAGVAALSVLENQRSGRATESEKSFEDNLSTSSVLPAATYHRHHSPDGTSYSNDRFVVSDHSSSGAVVPKRPEFSWQMAMELAAIHGAVSVKARSGGGVGGARPEQLRHSGWRAEEDDAPALPVTMLLGRRETAGPAHPRGGRAVAA